MRRPLVVGNWKMNGSHSDNHALIEALLSMVDGSEAAMAICAPFVYLDQLSKMLSDSPVKVGAQDLSVHLQGAYTGEISAEMLRDVQCQYVIVGHSERRQYHDESNLLVAQKALSAIKAGLTPIVCLGETLEQRESGNTLDIVGAQLTAVKSVLGRSLDEIIIAYEPIWAIGTGLTATPEQAQEIHGFIREQLGLFSDRITLLYGGSVKADNAADLFTQGDIDGALVGGASLVANDFVNIAIAAKR